MSNDRASWVVPNGGRKVKPWACVVYEMKSPKQLNAVQNPVKAVRC